MSAAKAKPVYLNGTPIGEAVTWHDVAALISTVIGRTISSRDAQHQGSEGPDGFYVSMDL